VAADAARQIYPGMKIRAFDGDAIHALGSGVFRWADVTLCGLDNREARLHVNRQCFRVGKPWIDGAIEQVQGVARVFVPDGHPAASGQPDQPCYECTMSERDWQLLQHRRSCAGLTRDEMAGGRTPTTPTIGSIIAGLQCQELVKLLHGLPVPAGAGLSFVGLSTDAFQTRYVRKPDCPTHDTLTQVVELNRGVGTTTVRQILDLARDFVGADAVIELGRDVLASLRCVPCGTSEPATGSLGTFRAESLRCPKCGQPRQVVTRNILRASDDALLNRTLLELGVPPFDLLTARGPAGTLGLLLAADAPLVLGELADEIIELA
jgi:adenylyltransferase/sulfurtransferase